MRREGRRVGLAGKGTRASVSPTTIIMVSASPSFEYDNIDAHSIYSLVVVSNRTTYYFRDCSEKDCMGTIFF